MKLLLCALLALAVLAQDDCVDASTDTALCTSCRTTGACLTSDTCQASCRLSCGQCDGQRTIETTGMPVDPQPERTSQPEPPQPTGIPQNPETTPGPQPGSGGAQPPPPRSGGSSSGGRRGRHGHDSDSSSGGYGRGHGHHHGHGHGHGIFGPLLVVAVVAACVGGCCWYRKRRRRRREHVQQIRNDGFAPLSTTVNV